MQKDLTVQLVFDTMCGGLEASWFSGRAGAKRILSRDTAESSRPNLIGPLNFSTPNRIQILGKAECAQLQDNSDSSQATPDADSSRELERLLSTTCDLIVIADNREPPQVLQRVAAQHDIAIFNVASSYTDCLNLLRYRLTQYLAESRVLHGVMMDVLGTGVLITGDSGVGKSELALELVSRGHILVADDAPEFRRIAPDTLEGRCPDLLQDFLEVRGLGILNISRMYGHAHTRKRKILKFIIRLELLKAGELNERIDRSADEKQMRDILGVNIAEQIIPVAPGRNLAVLVEAAVRNHILVGSGYNATAEFIDRQARALESDEAAQSEPRQVNSQVRSHSVSHIEEKQ